MAYTRYSIYAVVRKNGELHLGNSGIYEVRLRTPGVDQQWSQFNYIHQTAPLLGTAAICTHCYSLGSDTAIPGGLHAKPCHAFLVNIAFSC